MSLPLVACLKEQQMAVLYFNWLVRMLLSCHSSLVAIGGEAGNKNDRRELTCMTQNITEGSEFHL
jgi:hypothetical protein